MNKSNLAKLTKKVILATTSLLMFNNSSTKAIDAKPIDNSGSKSFEKNNYGVKAVFHFPKYVLHRSGTPDDISMSHRSHRSHSSHRSHASHYSSYTNPTPKKVEPKKDQTKKEQPTTIQKNQIINEFGSRILKAGMAGTDVVELQQLLKKLNLFNAEITGKFDTLTTESVKKYQEKNEIKVTGEADVLTFYYLKKDKEIIDKGK